MVLTCWPCICQVRQALLDELRHCAEVLRPFLEAKRAEQKAPSREIASAFWPQAPQVVVKKSPVPLKIAGVHISLSQKFKEVNGGD